MSLIAIIFFIVLACVVVAVLILAAVIYYKKYYMPRHATKPTTTRSREIEVISDGLTYENAQTARIHQSDDNMDNDVYEPYRYVNRAADDSPPGYYDIYQGNCLVKSSHTYVNTQVASSYRNSTPVRTFV